MSQESEKRSTFQSHQDSEQDVPRKSDGIDFKRAYSALIKGYIEVQMKKRAYSNAEGAMELTDEVEDKAKGEHE
ncbi:MAG: hypothetical protein DWB42_12665 [Chloroflexi bacterium]|nr:hypothetical protein [Chloroflexota bacterium]MDL1883151.1 hypothetical protein [Anaerolineae bacterium CFX8]GIL14736.1 MAG: hypothetical protein BroJett038_34560 [Chloroflexota bacterium]